MDEKENIAEDKLTIYDSDYWTKHVIESVFEEHRSEDEENEKKKQEDYQKGTFLCEKCGFIIDETEKNFEKEFKAKIKRDDEGNIKFCPNCKADQKFLKRISKEKKQELIKKKKIRQEKVQDKERKVALENIKDDLMDLLEDLERRVLTNEINVKRFVVIFMYLSKQIVDRNSKNTELDIDWLTYRKKMLEACQLVIDTHSIKEDSEKIMEELDDDIEQDKLYLAEMEYYINDDKYSIADYELSERIKAYDNERQTLFVKEQKEAAERAYQERRMQLEQKANEREKRRIERAIS